MIQKVSWNKIHQIWKNQLWPSRTSAIEPVSAMVYLGGYSNENMHFTPSFFGYFVDNNLVGVNSGHQCTGKSYRSRGLWVDEHYRKQGIGSALLAATIDQAMIESCKFVWSYPRKTSWSTYQSVGFILSSEWEQSETSEANAYCIKEI